MFSEDSIVSQVNTKNSLLIKEVSETKNEVEDDEIDMNKEKSEEKL